MTEQKTPVDEAGRISDVHALYIHAKRLARTAPETFNFTLPHRVAIETNVPGSISESDMAAFRDLVQRRLKPAR